MPKISECIDALAGCDYFSCLDMANGYYQLKMEEGDRDKTAFVTKYGMFLFNRMPFGLCNAPATFSRALALVLRRLSWDCVVSFLDDLIILGKGFEDHLTNMEKVFARFAKFKLKLKPKKCELFQREVIFLGHRVSGEGVAPNPAKIQEVQGWATPADRKQLESFLGLANYYREYVKGFAEVAAPLHALKGGKQPFSWGEEEQTAFEELKKRLTEAPVLVYPREGGGFILDTDASDKAIGGVLSQIQDREERVVGYESYVLSAPQRNYCVTRKELLAVVTFTRTYCHYLLGNHFSVRTDHGSLVWLMNFKNIEGQLARWLEELQEYDMEVSHRAGRAHGNADALSRKVGGEEFCADFVGEGVGGLPCGGCKFCSKMQEKWGNFLEKVDYVIPLTVRRVDGEGEDHTGWAGGYTREEIAELQGTDAGVGMVKQWVEAGGEPQREELMLASPEVKYLWGHRELLSVRQGILMYSWLDRREKWIIVAPKTLQKTILEFCHSKGVGGHFGIDKTFQKTRAVAIWHGQRNSCKDYVKGCAVCNRQKKGGKRLRGEQQLFHAGYTLERVHIDIMGPLLPTPSGNRYILVIVDQFTKWVEAYPMKDQQGQTVAKLVVGEFIARFGCPVEIHTDQGRNFEGILFKEMCNLLGMNKTRTTSFRPSANGQVERLNYSIAQIIRCFVGEKPEVWDEYVGLAASAIRATVNRSTGFTPNMLMLGREVRCPIDLMLKLGEGGEPGRGENKFIKEVEETWRTAHILAREELCMAQRRQKDYYDLRKRVVRFKVGDVVLRKNNAGVVGGSKKLNPVWKGEWVIVEVKSPVLFKVKNHKKTMVLHHDKLKLCTDEVLPRWVIRLRLRVLRDMENSSSSSEENEGQRGGAVGLGSEEGVESEWGISDSEEGNMAGVLADTEFSGDEQATLEYEDGDEQDTSEYGEGDSNHTV